MPTTMTSGFGHFSSQAGRLPYSASWIFCLHLRCFLNSTPYRSLLQLHPYPYVLILMCLMWRRALSSPQSVRWKKEEQWHDCRNVLLPSFLHLPQHPDRLLSLNPYAFLLTTKIVLDGDLRLPKGHDPDEEKFWFFFFLSIVLTHMVWTQYLLSFVACI